MLAVLGQLTASLPVLVQLVDLLRALHGAAAWLICGAGWYWQLFTQSSSAVSCGAQVLTIRATAVGGHGTKSGGGCCHRCLSEWIVWT